MCDWSSGWKEWLDAHPTADESQVFAEFNKRKGVFDYEKFVSHYDNLSEAEWLSVIQDAADKGYDIRSVLCYKKEYDGEDDFTGMSSDDSIMIFDSNCSFNPLYSFTETTAQLNICSNPVLSPASNDRMLAFSISWCFVCVRSNM